MAIKKVIKKAKPAVKPAPVMAPAATCACAAPCGCKKSFFKKLLVFIVIFALGFCACKFMCCGKMGMMHRMDKMFVEGCLDTSRMPAEKAEKLATADTDANGCVTKEEFKAAKKSWKRK